MGIATNNKSALRVWWNQSIFTVIGGNGEFSLFGLLLFIAATSGAGLVIALAVQGQYTPAVAFAGVCLTQILYAKLCHHNYLKSMAKQISAVE